VDPFLGEIRMFAGNFAPQGWALCNGQLLSIAQNTALFSLFGTTYGGNGQTTFALPNLQGRAPMHWGNGAGLTPRVLGEEAGTPTVTLTGLELPAHTHGFTAENEEASTGSPVGNAVAGSESKLWFTSGSPAQVAMSPLAIGAGGGNQPHNNEQPYLAVTFIVAMQGIFPSRN